MHLKRETTFSTALVKRYLQVTDKQFSEAAGVAQGVAPAQVIGNQGISENSPTLKNKAFPVIDHHDLSQEMPEWAMRDSNGGAQKPLYIEAALEQGTSRVAQGVARMQLSQVAALLIERWDELDEEEKIAVQVIIDR